MMRREKLKHLVTNGMTEEKCSKQDKTRKDVGWTTKVAKCRSGRCTKGDKGLRYEKWHDRLR